MCSTNTKATISFVFFGSIVNMTEENSIPLSITSTTGFGDCNGAGSVSSSTEQFIICCKICGSLNGLRRCSRCKSVYYCSQVHQQVDWRVHKIECKKFATNLATSELMNCHLTIWIRCAVSHPGNLNSENLMEKIIFDWISRKFEVIFHERIWLNWLS